MKFTNQEIIDETLNAPRGSLILSGDSYLIENQDWYQIVSPSRLDASRNEVIFSSLMPDEADSKIEEIIDFYSNLGTSFKWCTNPTTSPEDFPERLRKRGFKSWFSRGMYCDPRVVDLETVAKVDVENVSSSNIEIYLDLFIEGWGLDENLRPQLLEDFNWAMSHEDKRFQYFIVKNVKGPVGTAGFVNKGKSAYLIGGNILPKYRGKGFYKALVKKRLEIICDLGIGLATTGARDHTSAPILEKFGFKTAYKSEIFQFDLFHIRKANPNEANALSELAFRAKAYWPLR